MGTIAAIFLISGIVLLAGDNFGGMPLIMMGVFSLIVFLIFGIPVF